MQERMAKGREIQEAERRAQQEIIEARQKMEQTLVATIRELVNTRAAEKGLDLVYDKSFLPKANKALLDRLMFHLARVAHQEEVNKMSPANLGLVFGPCLLRRAHPAQAQQQLPVP